ncbi:MAG TPA: DUF4910 domain-containing protein [Armatimonadetes bacterium]|nr:DUF4910 domain-containing protein [Armatimonadota bacterium]
MAFYEPIWCEIENEVSGERAVELTEQLWQIARYGDFAHINETSEKVATLMEQFGLAEIRIVHYPADGVTHFGGWVMPQAWDVHDARLEIVHPKVDDCLLASFAESPLVVMSYSAPTMPKGITAPVVRVDAPEQLESWRETDVRGRIVFLKSASVRSASYAFAHGALGIICDGLNGMADDAPEFLKSAIRFRNYVIPPWHAKKGFGFSISFERGRQLRQLLDKYGDGNVYVRAIVDSKLYDGNLPLVTGLIPGESDEEVIITGHLCEIGANDNASGVALALEIGRTLKALVEQGKLPKLQRGIRLCHTVEVRGTNAFVNVDETVSRIIAGINLDMVGRDEGDIVCGAYYTTPALPAYTDALLAHLFGRAQRSSPALRFSMHSRGFIDDNVFGEPLIGAPCVGIIQDGDVRWHNSADTMEGISSRMLHLLGTISATFCATIATASDVEAIELARIALKHALNEIANELMEGKPHADRIAHISAKGVQRIRSVLQLAGDEAKVRAEVDKLIAHLRNATREMERIAIACGHAVRSTYDVDPKLLEHATALRLRKVIKGFIGFEHLTNEQRDELMESVGIGWSWGAPGWLQHALFLCDGTRSARDIWVFLRNEGMDVPLERLCDALNWACMQGFVEPV